MPLGPQTAEEILDRFADLTAPLDLPGDTEADRVRGAWDRLHDVLTGRRGRVADTGLSALYARLDHERRERDRMADLVCQARKKLRPPEADRLLEESGANGVDVLFPTYGDGLLFDRGAHQSEEVRDLLNLYDSARTSYVYWDRMTRATEVFLRASSRGVVGTWDDLRGHGGSGVDINQLTPSTVVSLLSLVDLARELKIDGLEDTEAWGRHFKLGKKGTDLFSRIDGVRGAGNGTTRRSLERGGLWEKGLTLEMGLPKLMAAAVELGDPGGARD